MYETKEIIGINNYYILTKMKKYKLLSNVFLYYSMISFGIMMIIAALSSETFNNTVTFLGVSALLSFLLFYVSSKKERNYYFILRDAIISLDFYDEKIFKNAKFKKVDIIKHENIQNEDDFIFTINGNNINLSIIKKYSEFYNKETFECGLVFWKENYNGIINTKRLLSNKKDAVILKELGFEYKYLFVKPESGNKLLNAKNKKNVI